MNIASCAVDEFSKHKVQCWDLNQYIYTKMKEEFDTNSQLPGYYSELEFCGGTHTHAHIHTHTCTK